MLCSETFFCPSLKITELGVDVDIDAMTEEIKIERQKNCRWRMFVRREKKTGLIFNQTESINLVFLFLCCEMPEWELLEEIILI